MRNRIVVGMLLVVLIGALPAFAQFLDSRPDVIAFYTSAAGNQAGVCTLVTPITLHLMITHPSDATGLTSYGCSFAVPTGLFSLGFNAPGGIIIGNNFPILDVGFATPQPAVGDAYTLGTWTVLLASSTLDVVRLIDHFPIEMYLAAYETAASSSPIAVTPPDWGNGMPIGEPWWSAVLWLNEPLWCGHVTAPEATAWGAVKTLFR